MATARHDGRDGGPRWTQIAAGEDDQGPGARRQPRHCCARWRSTRWATTSGTDDEDAKWGEVRQRRSGPAWTREPDPRSLHRLPGGAGRKQGGRLTEQCFRIIKGERSPASASSDARAWNRGMTPTHPTPATGHHGCRLPQRVPPGSLQDRGGPARSAAARRRLQVVPGPRVRPMEALPEYDGLPLDGRDESPPRPSASRAQRPPRRAAEAAEKGRGQGRRGSRSEGSGRRKPRKIAGQASATKVKRAPRSRQTAPRAEERARPRRPSPRAKELDGPPFSAPPAALISRA